MGKCFSVRRSKKCSINFSVLNLHSRPLLAAKMWRYLHGFTSAAHEILVMCFYILLHRQSRYRHRPPNLFLHPFGTLYSRTENGNRAHMITSNITFVERKKKKKRHSLPNSNEKWRRANKIRKGTNFGVKFIMIAFCVEMREYYSNVGALTESANMCVWERQREREKANDLYCACM